MFKLILEENMLRKKKNLFIVLIIFSLFNLPIFSKSSTLIKEEDGFYYGYGNGESIEMAMKNAKRDLIETALYTQARRINPRARRIHITDEFLEKRLPGIKPFKTDKKNLQVVYKIKSADWDKDEERIKYEMRKDFAEAFDFLANSTDISERVTQASNMIKVLLDSGEYDLLTLSSDSMELFSDTIRTITETFSSVIEIDSSIINDFVDSKSDFKICVRNENGIPIENLVLSINWYMNKTLPMSENDYSKTISAEMQSEKGGVLNLKFPLQEAKENNYILLRIYITFPDGKIDISKKDKNSGILLFEKRYFYVSDIKDIYPTVEVPGGTFKVGPVSGDKKVTKKEKNSTVSLDWFYIGENLVTNQLYSAYLFVNNTNSVPEYYENINFNLPQQPIIGITYEEVLNFISWFSKQTYTKYRLPSWEEWEVAARGGSEYVYPWGNRDPSFEKNANYNGNGAYARTSPVGVYKKGKNQFGIYDLAGNVWEFTSSKIVGSENTEEVIVKGGSWMDGPSDLRISNYKTVNTSEGYADVGFRLIKE